MDNKNECNCPICGQGFTPKTGVTPEEHLARGVLRTYSGMQKSTQRDELPCPRCGKMKMDPKPERNALSRHFDVCICNDCGTDEAMRVYKKNVLPLSVWFIVWDLLKVLPGVKCPKHIPDQNSEYPLCINRDCENSSKCGISAFMADNCGSDE
jgi:hypothetical protein